MSFDREDETRAVYERFHEACNGGDIARLERVVDEVLDPSAVFHAPVPMAESGPRALKNVWAGLLRAFPDIHVDTRDLIVCGDRLVARNTVTGTHRGPHLGIVPTGRAITYDEIFILRFADARIAEIWGVVDLASQLRQLGVLRLP